MKIVPPEPHVNLYSEGFEEPDVLQRKKVGAALSDLLNRIDDPVVVALDGKWGTGKTYFLKRWVGAHKIENNSLATTVYFDAFAHDYISDPLPALVSALANRLPKGKDDQIQKVKKAAFKLAKPLARVGLAVATFGATEAFNDLGDTVAEAIGDESKAALQKYWAKEEARRTAMTEFKQAIEQLASPKNKKSTGASVIIVVDELDRCRPDYALEVLEVIKHFFSVPHLHFVLGVNLQALENSVRARYGEKIDAQDYLKKFIQVTLELPTDLGNQHQTRRASIVYLEHLISEMGVPNHIGNRLQEEVELVSRCNDISMRDVGKIVSAVTLASSEVLEDEKFSKGLIRVISDLIVAKIVRPDLYPKFLDASVSATDLESYFGVTEKTVEREILDKDNPEYDHQIFLKYQTWLYLSQNELFDFDNSELAVGIKRQFGDYGRRPRPRSIPMQVHRQWLDQFSFYTS